MKALRVDNGAVRLADVPRPDAGSEALVRVLMSGICGTDFASIGETSGMVFFVWTSVFNLLAVTVFWSFMADLFDDAHAKRFYGYIGAGGTVGALLGPAITRVLVERIEVANLMLVSIGSLCVCLLCIYKLRPWAL